MKFLNLQIIAMMVLSLFLTSCAEDDDSTATQGQLHIEMTDAPVDDANVQAVMVTVADIKVDGEPVEGFDGKTTFDLKAYQQGEVKTIGTGNMDVGSYQNMELVFDLEQDAQGQSPGCYILTTDNQKVDLSGSMSSTMEINPSPKPFTVMSDQTTELVVDVDLRKAIMKGNNGQNDYEFSGQSQLDASARIVNKNEAGHISGDCQEVFTGSDKIVVYAYEKGTLDFDSESEASAQTGLRFTNATTSAAVKANNQYKLAFLEPGDYELVFVSYKDNDNNGTYELNGRLEVNTVLNINLSDVQVESGTEAVVDVSVTGLLPL